MQILHIPTGKYLASYYGNSVFALVSYGARNKIVSGDRVELLAIINRLPSNIMCGNLLWPAELQTVSPEEFEVV